MFYISALYSITDQITAEYIIHVYFVNRFQNETVNLNSAFNAALSFFIVCFKCFFHLN